MTHNWMRTLFEMEQLLSNKAQISMHDTQLDENLDLERKQSDEGTDEMKPMKLFVDCIYR